MMYLALRKLRENNGYTQQQIADALNINRSTYAYYESGKTTPDIDTIIKLAKIFNIDYIDLLETEHKFNRQRVSDPNFERNNLSNFNRKNNDHVYELTREEQKLIIGFRLLPQDLQEEITQEVYLKVKNEKNKN